jgi:hypothetical protein
MSPPSDARWEPHGFTIFCDDLREEVSGKTTYVGVYQDVMYVFGALPVMVPKLSFAIHLFHEPDVRFEALEMRIALPGEAVDAPGIRFDIDPQTLPAEMPAPDEFGDVLLRPRRHLTFKLELAPFQVQKYGRIRVSALWDGTFVPLGSLLVAPVPDTLQPAGIA